MLCELLWWRSRSSRSIWSGLQFLQEFLQDAKDSELTTAFQNISCHLPFSKGILARTIVTRTILFFVYTVIVSEVLKKSGQVMWTAKAHNARVILEWLCHVMTDFASKQPDDGRVALLASCACLCYEQFYWAGGFGFVCFLGVVYFNIPPGFVWFFLKHAWDERCMTGHMLRASWGSANGARGFSLKNKGILYMRLATRSAEGISPSPRMLPG